MTTIISRPQRAEDVEDIVRTSALARARRVEIMMGKLYELELNIQELLTTFTRL
jgi:hypothetical protein